jgi:hypothetical protein
VSGKTPVMGEGYVLWYVPSVCGTYRALKLPAAHIPHTKLNLVSTLVVFDMYGERFVCEGDGKLEGVDGDPLRPAIVVPRNHHSNLLISMATRMPIMSTPSGVSSTPYAKAAKVPASSVSQLTLGCGKGKEGVLANMPLLFILSLTLVRVPSQPNIMLCSMIGLRLCPPLMMLCLTLARMSGRNALVPLTCSFQSLMMMLMILPSYSVT